MGAECFNVFPTFTGYYLATAAEDACVKLWDLRKLKNFKTIALEQEDYVVRDLCFDQSGQYLAVAGSDVRSVEKSAFFLLIATMFHILTS